MSAPEGVAVGHMVDAAGVLMWPLPEGHLVSAALVLLEVVSPEGGVYVRSATSPHLTFVGKIGMLTVAKSVELSDVIDRGAPS